MNSPPDDATHPDYIGPYKVLEQLGRGGMGEVYLAQQTEAITRLVAVKVIKLGMDTKEVLARFDAEQQALALMDHPNIARVFDAGATEEGRPYFAMEYVRGLPLTEYSDLHKLSMRERLELFIAICQAVQHAHQKGVIHRDLKPSNVLVAVTDGDAVPKVIDFGIAKAISGRLTERTLHTELGQPLGTPAYMSPEQAEALGLDVDTRTDVYTLGVMLYELLVGALPLELEQVPDGAVAVVLRESEPPTPSDRFNTLGDRRGLIAAQRRTSPGSLRTELRGDLDWIVMKAMEKDRTRRYDTVNALALDIRRHIDHEPVMAGSPGAGYRLRKFARRHRIGVAAGAAIAASLLLGGVMATVSLVRAQRAERVSSAVTDFLDEVFRIPAPQLTINPALTETRGSSARELLDRGAERLRTELEGQPVVQARLMRTIGNVYGSLAQYQSAVDMLKGSLAIREAEFGPGHIDVAESLNSLATLEWQLGRYDEAEALFERALAIRERELGPEDPKVATVRANLATVWAYQGKYDQAESAFRRALEITENRLGPEHPDVALRLNGLGAVLSRRGQYTDAEPLFRRALAIWEGAMGSDPDDVATGLNNLGDLYTDQEKYGEAEPLLLRALAIREESLEPTSATLAASLYNLAKLYYWEARYADAEPLAARALSIWEATLEPDHPNLEAAIHLAAVVYWRLGQYDKAEPLYVRELDLVLDHPDVDPLEVANTMYYLADNYRDQGKYVDADTMYRQSLAALEALPDETALAAEILEAYAASLRRQGRLAAADSIGAQARTN